MYTAFIGRRLLDLYNIHRRDGPPLSPRQFFDEVFFPLVFDDDRYLMLANNSKFDQIAKQKKHRDAQERRHALALFHDDVETLDEPHGHLYLGGTARKVEAATSSQVTNVAIPVSPDEVYLSWIGAAAGIGVKGGLSMLVDADVVLLALFDGWLQYRAYMNQLATLKPYQIETWNGWWLIHCFGNVHRADDPLRDFPNGVQDEPGKNNKGQHAFGTAPWIKVIFALARQGSADAQISYVYSFGQTNTTIGFIRLDLPEVSRLPVLYERLFGEHDRHDRENLEAMYETQFGFATACQQGSIGLRAIEPKKLRKYMPIRRNPGTLPKTPKKDSDDITFKIYQTWIIAMLNNDDLLRQTQQAAEALHAFTLQAKRGKATHKTLVKEVLSSGNSRAFVEALTPILEEDEDGTNKELLNELVHSIVKMPAGNIPLFLALLRFKYAYVSA